MADENWKKLLQSWDLECLIGVFQENEIDDTALEELTPDLIKEMLPKIGIRMKFLNKWEEHIKKKGKKTVLTEPVGESAENEALTNTETEDTQSDNESSSSVDPVPHTLKRQNHFTSHSQFKKSCKNLTKSLNVRALLKSTAAGRCLLKSHVKGRTLPEKSQQLLTDLIITETLENFSGYGCAVSVNFKDIAEQIVEIFDGESIKTYYISPVRKRFTRSGRPIASKGKLPNKYRNKVRNYRRLSGCDVSYESSTAEESVTSEGPSDDVQNSVLWLQHNREPWDTVLKHWQITAPVRHETSKSILQTVDSFLSQWPILKQATGHLLIELDYKYLYNCEKEALFNNWENFFSHLKNHRPINNEKNAAALKELLSLETLSQDCKIVIQMMLLPHLIAPRGRIRIKKQHWKPSIAECQKSLIIHVKIPGDIPTAQQTRIDEMKNLGLTVQPYIIVVGPTLDSIQAFYVSLDSTLYQLPTALKAIDVCFKSFHALNAIYPPESEHLWYLIQLSLYNVTTKWDKQISYIADIVKSMPQFND